MWTRPASASAACVRFGTWMAMVELQGALERAGSGEGRHTRLAASVDSLSQRERCPSVKGFYFPLHLFFPFLCCCQIGWAKTSHVDDCHSLANRRRVIVEPGACIFIWQTDERRASRATSFWFWDASSSPLGILILLLHCSNYHIAISCWWGMIW